MIKIEIFPALNGDCFLVSIGESKKNHILIDSGYEITYDSFLKNKLLELKSNNEQILLFIMTHIHSDHIAGGIKLLKENGKANKPNIIRINEIWHNSLRHIQFNKINNDNLEEEKEILKSIIKKGYNGFRSDEYNDISAKEGSSFGSLILENKYNWNKSFNGNAIISDKLPIINIDQYTKIILLSPTSDKLKKLEKYWIKELDKLRLGFRITKEKLFDDAFEFLMMQEPKYKGSKFKEISFNEEKKLDLVEDVFIHDSSIVNGSSISFILEHDDKKLLFLGDAHSEDIEESLKKLISNGYNSHFDCIKLSHHGSENNTSPDLLNIIDVDKYIISTNSFQHNHPDLNCLARIFNLKNKKQKSLYFNYNNEIYNFLNNGKLQKKYNYSINNVNINQPNNIIL